MDQAQACSLLSHNLVAKIDMFGFLYLCKILKDLKKNKGKKSIPML
jgi:hypothetical protein